MFTLIFDVINTVLDEAAIRPIHGYDRCVWKIV